MQNASVLTRPDGIDHDDEGQRRPRRAGRSTERRQAIAESAGLTRRHTRMPGWLL